LEFSKKKGDMTMNILLKAMLKEAMDLVATGEAAVKKNWAGLFACLVQDGADAPALITNWADLKPEVEKLLVDPSADADLLAYAASLVGGESASAAAVISASADLILTAAIKVEALVVAIKAAKA